MKKRFLSVILAVLMVFSTFSVFAEDLAENITVYVSVSKHGEIAKDKNGLNMACREIALGGQASYTLDDAFLAMHEIYYEDGANGYETSYSENWGLGVAKMWGDTSYQFGYQVNGGLENVLGPAHEIENGDYIDVALYQNAYPDTENYTSFRNYEMNVFVGETLELTLIQSDGYDPVTQEPLYGVCTDAIITVNGEETETLTDGAGNVSLCFDEPGTYLVSAKKDKVITVFGEPPTEEVVPAITAPVCIVTATLSPEEEIMHNIANRYKSCDLTQLGGNLPWIVADMSVYEELFPESEFCLDEAQKETAKNKLVEAASAATTPGDLAKYIIGLRALGFDAKKLYTEEFLKVDIVNKLTALVEENQASVYNPYTLSYVLIALSQAEGYATGEQLNGLVSAAVTTTSDWYDLTYGTDAITPMVLALAPFYEIPDVAAVVDDAIEIIIAEQREDGLINGPEGYEPASTGLALCAFSALGTDPNTIVKGENSLIDGLLSTATEDKSGFPNTFATEQGFRGLLAWRLFKNGAGKRVYDFEEKAMEEANAAGAYLCPVNFHISPTSAATVFIEGQTPLKQNTYDLAAGTYSYTVSAPYYITETGTFTVTAEEEAARTLKTQNVSLLYAGGGGGSYVKPEKEPEKEPEQEVETEKNELTEETFPDVSETDWYYPSVKYVYEKNLFRGTDSGFEPESTMTRAMLVTVLYRLASPEKTTGKNVFSDVSSNAWYTESISWAAENNIVGGVEDGKFAPDANLTREQLAVILYRFAKLSGLDTENIGTDLSSYEDAKSISSYAEEAMRYAVKTGLIKGRTEKEIAPKESITRAEVATILMRFDEVATAK